MKHYYKVILCFPDGSEDELDEKFETESEAQSEGLLNASNFSAGADVLALAGENYMSGSLEFRIKECFEDENGNIIESFEY